MEIAVTLLSLSVIILWLWVAISWLKKLREYNARLQLNQDLETWWEQNLGSKTEPKIVDITIDGKEPTIDFEQDVNWDHEEEFIHTHKKETSE